MTEEISQNKNDQVIFYVSPREKWAINLLHKNGGVMPLYRACGDERSSLSDELFHDVPSPYYTQWVYRNAARLAYRLEKKGLVKVEYRQCPYHKNYKKGYVILSENLKDYYTYENMILPSPLFS